MVTHLPGTYLVAQPRESITGHGTFQRCITIKQHENNNLQFQRRRLQSSHLMRKCQFLPTSYTNEITPLHSSNSIPFYFLTNQT